MSEAYLLCGTIVVVLGLTVFSWARTKKDWIAILVGLAIGLPLAVNLLNYSNAKHAHDHEPQIARGWR
jgi:hypothetical protein